MFLMFFICKIISCANGNMNEYMFLTSMVPGKACHFIVDYNSRIFWLNS